jgi:hypothetical protein
LLGGDVAGNRVLCPGPAHSKNDRSLSVRFNRDARDGFIVHSFANDDPILCRDYVRDCLGLPPWQPGKNGDPPMRRPKYTTPAARSDDDKERRRSRALSLWGGAANLLGTPAETYLTSRGVWLDEDLSHCLRFHGALPRGKTEKHAGMVALMRDTVTNEPTGIHRTYLLPNGKPVLNERGEKDRRMLGPAGIIKLDAHEDVTHGIHIGEGIETCLAAMQLGYRPVWALGSAGEIERFPVLAGIEAITVFVENDITSSHAADVICKRYENAGCEALISAPPEGDWNDVIRGRP